MNNEFDLAELTLHLDALKLHLEKSLPEDIKQKLQEEIEHLEKQLEKLK